MPEQDAQPHSEPISLVDPIPSLTDPAAPEGRILLNRFLEKQQFAPWLTAVVFTILLFIGFNVIGAVVVVVNILAHTDLAHFQPASFAKLIEKDVSGQLVGNTFGQWLGLGLPVLWLARLHSSQSLQFLRLRGTDIRLIGWALLGWLCLYPVINLTAMLNQAIPMPQVFKQMDDLREDFFMNALKNIPLSFLLVAVALTPAFCEELLFRGYVQRQMERTFKTGTALIVTGLVFGLYHLTFSQLLPLSFLGIYLCFVTWKSNSLLPAMVVHWVHNGSALIMGSYLIHQKNMDLSKADQLPGPLYGVILIALMGMYGFYVVEQKMGKINGANPLSFFILNRKDHV